MTFSAPLKAKLRLSMKDPDSESEEYSDTIESIVYLGNIPIMTRRGTFIINGAERIVVSQLHRSPGVFFDELIHPNGTKIYSARIIPLRGAWVEFTTDINDVMYVFIDRRKKFPVTTLLRVIGYYSDEECSQLRDLLDKHLPLFDRKVSASLLHMDVWGQNILIDNSGDLTGLVDWDRALWGDPEIEFAVLDYCGVSHPAFWEGYGQERDYSKAAQVRNLFYLLYELQKYIVIRHGRNHDPASARQYKHQVIQIVRRYF